MLKFFRKYNTVILVFGGVFLMIAFLLPQAIQQFSPNALNRKLFKAGDVTYGVTEVSEATRQNAVIANTFDPLVGFRNSTRLLMGIESTDHYLMLAQMAEEMGLYNPGGQPGEMLPRLLAQFSTVPITDARIDQLQQAYDAATVQARDPELAAEALRRLDSIIRLRQYYGVSTSLSEPELALYASRLFDSAVASIGMLTGAGYASTLEPVTEADIVAQYEAYRDDTPEDNAYGFSYRLGDAAKFELLIVDRRLISDAIELDPIELRKYHRVNIESKGYSNDYRVAKSRVELDVRREKTDEIMKSILGAVNNQLVNVQSQLEREDDGRRILPTDWADTRPTFESLAETANAAAATQRIVTPEPVARVLRFDDTWYTREAITNAEEIRLLGLTVQGRRASLANAIMLFPEFEPVNAVPEAQMGVTIGGLDSGSSLRPGDGGFLRLLDVRREGPSTSLDEVREEVERDAKALRGYKALLDRQDEFRERALETEQYAGYVYEVFDDEETTTVATGALVTFYNTVTRTLAPNFISGVDNPELVSALSYEAFARDIIERITGFDPTVQVDSIPSEERFFVIEAPKAQALAFVYVTGRTPVTSETLRLVSRSTTGYLVQRLLESNPEARLRASLDRISVAKRLGYTGFDPDYTLVKDEDEDGNPLN